MDEVNNYLFLICCLLALHASSPPDSLRYDEWGFSNQEQSLRGCGMGVFNPEGMGVLILQGCH